MVLAQSRNVDPQDRTESLSEVNPLIYGQLINKGGASTRRWKESLQQMVLGNSDSYVQRSAGRSFFNSTHENKLNTD